MGDIAALTGAAIGLSYVVLRIYTYVSVVSLCREALRSGRQLEAKVRWSLALEVSTGTASRANTSSNTSSLSDTALSDTANVDALSLRGSRRDADGASVQETRAR
jgi:hypothetical protein